LNRARELQHKVSVFREFETAGAEHHNAPAALICSSRATDLMTR